VFTFPFQPGRGICDHSFLQPTDLSAATGGFVTVRILYCRPNKKEKERIKKKEKDDLLVVAVFLALISDSFDGHI
jgi:hypothetical protein